MSSEVALVLLVAVCANLALTLYAGARMFRSIGKLREESSRADQIARAIKSEWENFVRTQAEHIRQRAAELEQRAETLEARVDQKVAELEEMVTNNRIQIRRLERYLREFFEVELKNVFDSFDNTVNSTLDEMKRELLRGVDRIEEIQAIVESRDVVEGRLVEGRAAIESLTGEVVESGPRSLEQEKEREKLPPDDSALEDSVNE